MIAAVEGYAVAGALELAVLADTRLASTLATHRRTMPCIGHDPEGRAVVAEEALQWGLADRLAEQGQARTTAIELAKQLACFPQHCLRADRGALCVRQGRGDGFDDI